MNRGFTCELKNTEYDDAVVYLKRQDKYLVTVGGRYGETQYQRTFFVPKGRWENHQEYAMLVEYARTLKDISSLRYDRQCPVICPEMIQAFDLQGLPYQKVWGGCGWKGTKAFCHKHITHDSLHFHCPLCGIEVDERRPALAVSTPGFGYVVHYDG